MRKTYRITIADESSEILFYPGELGNLKDIDKIYFGQHSSPAIVKKHEQGPFLTLSQGLADALNFRETNSALHLFIHNNSLHIGPIVGVFSAGFTNLSTKPLGERTDFFAKLLSLKTMTGCIPYVFGEQHIDWEKELIHAYLYVEDHWEEQRLPFPNVIYDRLPNRKVENSEGPKEVKRKFQELYTIPWYNPGFFNKWDVYEQICLDEAAQPYLPETYPFTSFSNVEYLLSLYRQVFIKPIHGSLGLGIHQIIYDKHDNVYYCRFQNDEKQNKLLRFSSLEALVNHLFRDRKLENLIVQQGISLVRHNKRPLDFRVHTNKNSNGQWEVTAIAAKIAGPGSVTTHIKNGGVVKTLQELYPNGDEAVEIHNKLSDAALTLSKSLETNLDGIIAEIGFDFGLDNQGNVWMFEANSKPGRSIFNHPKLKEFDLLTRKLSLDYAIYLTEQSIGVSK